MRTAGILVAVAMGFAAFPAGAASPGADVFRTRTLAENDLAAVPQWTEALARAQAEARALRAPASGAACAGISAAAWCATVDAVRPLPPERQVAEINRFVNAMLGRVKTSAEVPPPGAPWPGLTEALRGQGGAAAAALAKYLALREAGVPAARLRVVIADDVLRGTRTALLLARADTRELVLAADTDALRGTASTANLRPYYSFNETTLWMHIPEPQETSP